MTIDVRVSTASPVRGPVIGVLLQAAVLGGLQAGVGLGISGWLAGVTFAVGTWVLLTGALLRSGATTLGPANAVTLARATLVGGVTALVADALATGSTHATVLVSLAVVAWLMDGVDGQVARRTGTTTGLGARFDGEVDSVLVLVLSVYAADSLGAWVVAFGAYRYAFVAAGWLLPWLRGDLPRRQSRSAIAALAGIVLIVAAAGVVPTPVLTVVAGLALAVLTGSFARDTCFLHRADARQRTASSPAARLAVVPEPLVGAAQS